MFGRKRKETPQHESAPHSFRDDGTLRVAIAEDGQIVYASDTFYALSHIDEDQKSSVDVHSILKFTTNIDTINDVDPGIHAVRINGHRDEFNFQFDWLTAPDSKRYLVGSQALAEQKTGKAAQTTQTSASTPQAEGSLNNAQELELFMNMAHEAMAVVDDEGKILRVNATFHTLIGTDENDLGALEFIDLFANEDKPYIRNTVQTPAYDSGGENTAIDFEAQVNTKGGQRIWMEWRQYRAGDLLYCIGRDTSSIRQQEEALKSREKQLEQAESIGRMGHWHWTIGQDEITWSDEIYRIFGFERGEFNPTIESMAALINRRDIARVNQAFERAIIESNDYDMEFSIKRPNGEVRYIRCEGRCALDEDDDVTALYGIMQDMTERILYEDELKNAKDAAERAYATKTQFLANMSHELRTPLNAIIGFSEMMQQQLLGPIGTEKYLEYVGGIRESGGHLLDLISDILDMSKIEAGKYELVLEEFNIAKTMKLAAHMMESRALDGGVKLITTGVQNDALKVVGDRRAFLQIVLNLISNAVKFTKGGGQVAIECHEREDYIAIKVIDNGIGIPANKLSQITRPFEQVSSSYAREHEGSGLGLAITKELVEMHGGNLHIESRIDEGTTVTVRLPYDAFKTTQSNEVAKKTP